MGDPELGRQMLKDLNKLCNLELKHTEKEGVLEVLLNDESVGFLDASFSDDQINLICNIITNTHSLCMKEAATAYIKGIKDGAEDFVKIMKELKREKK